MKLKMVTGEEVLLDNEDYERICEFIIESGSSADPSKWQANYCSTEATPKIYATKSIGGRGSKKWRMHRLIFYLRGIDIEDAEVDHVDSEATLDNRWSNLRISTSGQNKINRATRGDNKLGIKRVERLPGGNYVAYIRRNGKKTHLGTFKTPREAALAYNRAAIELWGEYAWTNKVARPKK